MKEKIIQSIYSSIETLNSSVNKDNPLPLAVDTKLFGGGSQLDSLGLINLVVSVEEKIGEEFNTSITLADDRALSQEVSPFITVSTLASYVEILLNESRND